MHTPQHTTQERIVNEKQQKPIKQECEPLKKKKKGPLGGELDSWEEKALTWTQNWGLMGKQEMGLAPKWIGLRGQKLEHISMDFDRETAVFGGERIAAVVR